MKHWLRPRRRKVSPGEGDTPGIELLVLEGADAGQKFTIDASEVAIGRQSSDAELQTGILLRDATVSARQAVIRHENGSHVIEHLSAATNPTLVNGSAIRRAILVPGSQIQIGRVLMDVRSQQGTALRDFTQLYAAATAAERADDAGADPASRAQHVATTAELDPRESEADAAAGREIGWLEVREDPAAGRGVRHPIRPGRTAIGRSSECEVRIENLGVSRKHAELVWEGERLVLYHLSATNLTALNRREVARPIAVHSGDEILLAGRVAIGVRLATQTRPTAARVEQVTEASAVAARHNPEPSGLRAVMEDKLALDQRIAEEFSVEGSFVDVDVVDSMGMKAEIDKPERIIVSFERFRAYVSGIVAEFRGHVLNSNGDELMCFFESSHDAVRAGSAIFSRLEHFNRDQNLLDAPFRFRIGVHSGQSLVDLKRGIAYSTILDVAGHLQKLAPSDRMAISEQTLVSLPAGLPFKWAGKLEREGFDYYLLEGQID